MKLLEPGYLKLTLQVIGPAAPVDDVRGHIEAQEARIRELEESLAKYQACRVHDVDEKNWLRDRVNALEEEVRILRMYGNKDCTAMADAALATAETKGDASAKSEG